MLGKRLSLVRIRRSVGRRVWRAFKFLAHLSRSWTGTPSSPATPVFIWGCHRSGTKMLLRTLDRSLQTWVYPEHNRRAFGPDFRLRSLSQAEDLVRASRAPVVVFKPICDSHRADLMLEHFDERDPRGLWIYRRYPDVVNSLVRKWGDQFAGVVRTILDGRQDRVGWRGERIDESRLRTMSRITPDEISAEEGAAVFWWLRNSFYLDLNLESDSRVRLVSYDRLVRNPGDYLFLVFRFAGVPFETAYADRIHADAVGRESGPELSASVQDACEEMTMRLEEAHGKRQP